MFCLQETEQTLKRELGLEGASQMDTSTSAQLAVVTQRSVIHCECSLHPLQLPRAYRTPIALYCTCTTTLLSFSVLYSDAEPVKYKESYSR